MRHGTSYLGTRVLMKSLSTSTPFGLILGFVLWFRGGKMDTDEESKKTTEVFIMMLCDSCQHHFLPCFAVFYDDFVFCSLTCCSRFIAEHDHEEET